MSSSRVKLNLRGFRELRKQPRVKSDLARRASRVAAAAGPGFGMSEAPSRSRARYTVGPDTGAAVGKVRRDPGLLVRALNAGK